MVARVSDESTRTRNGSPKSLQGGDDCTNGVERVLPKIIGNSKIICDLASVERAGKTIVKSTDSKSQRAWARTSGIPRRDL